MVYVNPEYVKRRLGMATPPAKARFPAAARAPETPRHAERRTAREAVLDTLLRDISDIVTQARKLQKDNAEFFRTVEMGNYLSKVSAQDGGTLEERMEKWEKTRETLSFEAIRLSSWLDNVTEEFTKNIEAIKRLRPAEKENFDVLIAGAHRTMEKINAIFANRL